MNIEENEKFFFDDEAADRVVYFIQNHIKHSKGEYGGKPFILQDWQVKIVRDIFGWKHRDSGLRRFRTCYLSVPRKNGKSTLISAIGIYMTVADNEASAEVYVAAADRTQAGIIFDQSSTMVRMDNQLNANFKVFRNSIIHEKSNSSFKAISAEASSKFGFNASCIIMDEFFVQKDAALWDALRTSTGSRSQPLTIAITTAGYNKESICYKTQDYGKKVADGIIEDDSFYYCVYAADLEDDWTDPETWRKANPCLDAGIIKIDYLKTECEKAQRMPSYENTFKMLHLNLWVSSSAKWISDKDWMKCNQGDLKLEDFRGVPCYAGLDLASVRDVTALVLIFVEDERVSVIPYFFTPKENAYIRSRRDGVDYLGWGRDGFMDLTEGDVTDYNFIKAKLMEIAEIVDLKLVHYDRWNASQLVIECIAEGLPMQPLGQGFVSISAPTKQLEHHVLNKELNHGGNPVLRWMVSNLAMKLDAAGNIKPDKSKSSEKIDGVVSLVMALAGYMNSDQDNGSVYDEGGFIFI